MSLGSKVKQLREMRGLSQEDLAKAVGYKTRSSIAKIETDGSDPSQKMLLKIAEVLEVNPGELIVESNPVLPQSSDEEELVRDFALLPPDQQRQVLEFAKFLLSSHGSGSAPRK